MVDFRNPTKLVSSSPAESEGGTAPTIQPEIPKVVETINKELVHLEDILLGITNRLFTVLAPLPPSDESDKELVAHTGDSPLGQELHDITSQVRMMRKRMDIIQQVLVLK